MKTSTMDKCGVFATTRLSLTAVVAEDSIDIRIMSGLEARCTQFHDAAMGTGKTKGDIREMTTLRKFLHKNQEQRFTDKATSRLFDTIQIYCNSSSSRSSSSSNDKTQGASKQGEVPQGTVEREKYKEAQEGLLEDALMMPFTVFTTKNKKVMMRWLEDLRGGNTDRNSKKGGTTSQETRQILSVIDLDDDNRLSLMDDDTGETYEEVPLPLEPLGRAIKEAYESTDSTVQVSVRMDSGSGERLTILQLVGEETTGS